MIKKRIFATLTVLLGWCMVEKATANGWEHTAIPVTALISALGNEDAEIRQRAAHSLGHHPTEDVARILIESIERGESGVQVRQALFSALGRIGYSLAVPVIARCLETEEEVSVRTLCAVALENIRTPEAEKAALRAIKDSESPVKLAAISSLGRQQSLLAAQTLAAYLQSDEERTVLVTIRALGNTRQEQALVALEPLISSEVETSKLVEVLKAVAVIGSGSVSKQVKAVLGQSNDPRVKRHALIALGSIDKTR